MAVKIRLARIGRIHAPVYRIVAINSQRKRDGKFLENLGTYNPLTKELLQYHEDRIAYWVSVGAIMVDSVKKLQKMHDRKKKAAAEKVAVAPVIEKKSAAKKEAAVEKKAVKKSDKTDA